MLFLGFQLELEEGLHFFGGDLGEVLGEGFAGGLEVRVGEPADEVDCLIFLDYLAVLVVGVD